MPKYKQSPVKYILSTETKYRDNLKGKSKSFTGDIPEEKNSHYMVTVNIELKLWHAILGAIFAFGIYKLIVG